MPRASALRNIRWKQHDESSRPYAGRLRDLMLETIPFAAGYETEAHKRKRTSVLRNAMLESAPVVTATSAEDEARQLLLAAAEIEHALLVEYLYAAMSMKSSLMRRTVVLIAVQEMSHLLAVQNLLLFLGASPYFERYDVSPNPALDPFPFQLRGLRNKETIERFVLAEMPVLQRLDEADQAIIEEIRKRLDPKASFHRVGVLYARIYWLFQTGDAPEGDWKDVANIADVGPLPKWHISQIPGKDTAATTQASRSETGVRLNGDQGEIWYQDSGLSGAFGTIDSRQAALRVIYEIAGQGEGLVDEQQTGERTSHFQQFFDALKQFDEIAPSRFHAVPDNPSTAPSEGHTEITEPTARALCQFFNIRYQIMLVALTAALQCSRTNNEANALRQRLVFWAFFEMRVSTRGIADEIVRWPCVSGGNPIELCGGPPFELTDVRLDGDLDSLSDELRRLHVAARPLIATLKQLGFGTNGDFVSEIETTDLQRYPNI